MAATWKSHSAHGKLDTADREELPASVYAFPKKRKEPMTDASHVRNAMARFDQVQDVSNTEREQAFSNIKAAAKHYKVEMTETSWKDFGGKAHTANKSKSKTTSTKKAPAKKAGSKKTAAKKTAAKKTAAKKATRKR